ncbi:XRE family transcriptional regulator [Candidatus Peregrinibacteria bacterium CG10_big_fil_rev_8_21_14_0_10_42_8]|nr:MAG: XRE family transcriptional regulator [Candidatus Peregrinibacteria bacterium CG10_big_fil_rev_8_21_14_0_10_42_8]
MPHILTQLREQNGYTQEELAEAIGVSRQHIAKVERGEADLKLAQASQCAKLFDISVDNLSSGEMPAKSTLAKKVEEKAEATTSTEERDPTPQLSVDPERVQKFKEVLLYILGKVGAKPNVGKTVLYKLLYFSDFDFYEKFEEQLIGATYKKIARGPAPVEFAELVGQMKEEDELQEIRGKYYDKEQIKFIPLRKPNLRLLKAHEVGMIDDVLQRLSDKTATDISEYSHKDVPWKVHEMGEVIDYESVFYRDSEFSVRDEDDEL